VFSPNSDLVHWPFGHWPTGARRLYTRGEEGGGEEEERRREEGLEQEGTWEEEGGRGVEKGSGGEEERERGEEERGAVGARAGVSHVPPEMPRAAPCRTVRGDAHS